MKLSATFLILIVSLLSVAVQSCSLSGNEASKQDTGLLIVKDSISYITDIQSDSNNRMVSLTNYLQPLFKDIRYETPQNFTKKQLYTNAEPFLRLPAAKALQAVQNELKLQDLAIKLFDAYRPYSVTVEMWKIVPDERYAANPSKGSGHNRGIAVDLTLVDLNGKELPMPTDFDDFSEKAHHDYMNLDPRVITNRNFLRNIMQKHGFVPLQTEWWHYYLPSSSKYSILDFDFEQLRKFEKNF